MSQQGCQNLFVKLWQKYSSTHLASGLECLLASKELGSKGMKTTFQHQMGFSFAHIGFNSEQLLVQIGKNSVLLCYGVQKIRFMDSFCPTMFKRFVLWIRFVLQCSKDGKKVFQWSHRPNAMPELICQDPVEVFLNPPGRFTRMCISLMKERFQTLDGFQLCPTMLLF